MFKRKDVIFILWLTFITVAAWVGFNIYHIAVTSTIDEELQVQITPIDPNFDIDTIDALKSREKIDPLYQFQGSIQIETDLAETGSSAAEIIITPTDGLVEEVPAGL